MIGRNATIPISFLLDSLEAIDSERIAEFVEFLTDSTGYLSVALLPKGVAVLSSMPASLTSNYSAGSLGPYGYLLLSSVNIHHTKYCMVLRLTSTALTYY